MGWGTGGWGTTPWGSGVALTAPRALPVLSVFPAQDTIRGGSDIFIAADGQLLDLSEDESFLSESLPSAWSTASSGSAVVSSTLLGVELKVGPTSTGVAALATSAGTFGHFDATIDVEVLSGPPVNVVDAVDLALFEHRIDANTRFYVALSVLPLLSGVYARAFIIQTGTFEPLVAGTTTPISVTGKLTLRLIRNLSNVFASVGVRSETSDSFVSEIPLLQYTQFSALPGDFRFEVKNQTNAVGVRTRFSDFEIRTHGTIDGELLVEKSVLSDRRISGVVPATTIDRRGLRDIVLFGLFGELVQTDGFEYTLPSPMTASRRAGQDFLRTYVDAQLRDEE